MKAMTPERRNQLTTLLLQFVFTAAMVYTVLKSLFKADAGRFDEATYYLLWGIIWWFLWFNLRKPPKVP
jgi:hypothetical protein